MKSERLVLLILVFALYTFGLAVWIARRRNRPNTSEQRFVPIWKQRHISDSDSSFRWSLAGSLTVSMASLFPFVAILLAWAYDG